MGERDMIDSRGMGEARVVLQERDDGCGRSSGYPAPCPLDQLWAHVHLCWVVPSAMTTPCSALLPSVSPSRGSPVSWGLGQPWTGQSRNGHPEDEQPRGSSQPGKDGSEWINTQIPAEGQTEAHPDASSEGPQQG